MHDLTARNNGLFTSFIPNTPAGIVAYNAMAAQGGSVIQTNHLMSIIAQLKRAGYSVTIRRSKGITHGSDDELLAALTA